LWFGCAECARHFATGAAVLMPASACMYYLREHQISEETTMLRIENDHITPIAGAGIDAGEVVP
jgi:hypothetical protein